MTILEEIDLIFSIRLGEVKLIEKSIEPSKDLEEFRQQIAHLKTLALSEKYFQTKWIKRKSSNTRAVYRRRHFARLTKSFPLSYFGDPKTEKQLALAIAEKTPTIVKLTLNYQKALEFLDQVKKDYQYYRKNQIAKKKKSIAKRVKGWTKIKVHEPLRFNYWRFGYKYLAPFRMYKKYSFMFETLPYVQKDKLCSLQLKELMDQVKPLSVKS